MTQSLMTPDNVRPAVFVDRDGTLIEEVNYLSRVEDLRLFPFTRTAVERLKAAGYLVIVITNQSGIGRGVYDEAAMHRIHEAIQHQLGGAIDAFYFCPHLPCDGCSCRKPRLGMIEAAVKDLPVDLSRSWFIGDKKIDVETGFAAELRSVLVLTGYGSRHQDLLERQPDLITADLGAAADKISELAAAEIVI